MIAALYVEPDGPYANLEGVEVWDEARDARTYAGPHPVVAHPPCARWSVASIPHGTRNGEDGGAFSAALAAVRNYGGVLEHPAYSMAWQWFGLLPPPLGGGWVNADWLGGWTCHVEQGFYGHEFGKRTWLYAVGIGLPSLKWGVCKRPGVCSVTSSNAKVRRITPEPFRDLLLSMARSVRYTRAFVDKNDPKC